MNDKKAVSPEENFPPLDHKWVLRPAPTSQSSHKTMQYHAYHIVTHLYRPLSRMGQIYTPFLKVGWFSARENVKVLHFGLNWL
jgi:hypothetical protein